ncbi:hypothetical protein FA10DRAFT_48700 [Acaromyces ingoldii]|uniref:Uncharacterized protein n=1 Tax=Acaromyces ingoldii TaxID=215250 RepID=A0A316Z2L1_9BASI|nr:hypothetical protein FA10DRAFT_48700 [Acaromyces ingoldii]PWN94423.1 hypothetical protein FA10DRAFT_48700 [Acaromyces ingoldii]
MSTPSATSGSSITPAELLSTLPPSPDKPTSALVDLTDEIENEKQKSAHPYATTTDCGSHGRADTSREEHPSAGTCDLAKRLKNVEAKLGHIAEAQAAAVTAAIQAQEEAKEAQTLAGKAQDRAQASEMQVGKIEGKTVPMRAVEDKIKRAVEEMLNAQQDSLLAIKLQVAELKGMVMATLQTRSPTTMAEIPHHAEEEDAHPYVRSATPPDHAKEIHDEKPESARGEHPQCNHKRKEAPRLEAPGTKVLVETPKKRIKHAKGSGKEPSTPSSSGKCTDSDSIKPTSSSPSILQLLKASQTSTFKESSSVAGTRKTDESSYHEDARSSEEMEMLSPSAFFGLVDFLRKDRRWVNDAVLRQYIPRTKGKSNVAIEALVDICTQHICICETVKLDTWGKPVKAYSLTNVDEPFWEEAVNAEYFDHVRMLKGKTPAP